MISLSIAGSTAHTYSLSYWYSLDLITLDFDRITTKKLMILLVSTVTRIYDRLIKTVNIVQMSKELCYRDGSIFFFWTQREATFINIFGFRLLSKLPETWVLSKFSCWNPVESWTIVTTFISMLWLLVTVKWPESWVLSKDPIEIWIILTVFISLLWLQVTVKITRIMSSDQGFFWDLNDTDSFYKSFTASGDYPIYQNHEF